MARHWRSRAMKTMRGNLISESKAGKGKENIPLHPRGRGEEGQNDSAFVILLQKWAEECDCLYCPPFPGSSPTSLYSTGGSSVEASASQPSVMLGRAAVMSVVTSVFHPRRRDHASVSGDH